MWLVSFFASPSEPVPRTQISYSPLASEKYAIFDPSGDQTASFSLEPLLLVRFLVGPCSYGTVKTSPLAETSALLPDGDTSISVI